MEDDDKPQHMITPVAQGRDTPMGWKPTIKEPMSVIRCCVIKKDGNRCERWSVRGWNKCIAHGKGEFNFKTVQAMKEAHLEAARMRLFGMTDDAIDTLKQLLEPGTAEGIRLKAATEVLDRAGIRNVQEVEVEIKDNTSAAELVMQRLQRLSGKKPVEDDGDDESTIDAEVIE